MPAAPADQVDDFAWLGAVRDVHHPINLDEPIIVRSNIVDSPGARYQPTVPHPEQHPYCELGVVLTGKAIQFVGRERIDRPPGSLLLMGPGLPHYALHVDYPHHAIIVHFLPILLLEMGPKGDGARLLSRFTGSRSLADRVFQPAAARRAEFAGLFSAMVEEFSGRQQGSELRLRSLLAEILVRLLRHEQPPSANPAPVAEMDQPNWQQVEKALRFIHENYRENLYVREITKATGLNATRLQAIFRSALGMSCVHYLRAYRISQAKTLLCLPGARITEVAFGVGFDTLSHFNTSFRNQVGMSPTEYMRSSQKKGPEGQQKG